MCECSCFNPFFEPTFKLTIINTTIIEVSTHPNLRKCIMDELLMYETGIPQRQDPPERPPLLPAECPYKIEIFTSPHTKGSRSPHLRAG